LPLLSTPPSLRQIVWCHTITSQDRAIKPWAVECRRWSRLERKDFMHRTRGEDDRRSQHLFLTERGRRLKAELLPIGVAINRSALVGVDPAHAGLAATFSNG
jgi:hypothetical protein